MHRKNINILTLFYLMFLFFCLIYYLFVASYFNQTKTMLKENSQIKLGNKNQIQTYIKDHGLNNNRRYYSNNKQIVLKPKDNKKPEIILIKKDINLNLNGHYFEYGYNAKDDCDGNITNKVVVTNNIDTSKIGTYYVNYTVFDSSGNKTVVKRKVNVVKKLDDKGVSILLYHFFYDPSIGERPRKGNETYSIDLAQFDEEMKYLKENNYYFPTWEELEQYIDGNIVLPKESIIITIDDGNESFFRLAYPVLKKYGINATVFIITAWIPLDNYNYVDRNIIDYESHTNNMHVGGCKTRNGGIFQCISYEKAYNDITTSTKVLGSNEVFAYPFGDYNDRAIEILKKTGFKMAVTINGGRVKIGANKYLLPRVEITDSYILTDFANKIK